MKLYVLILFTIFSLNSQDNLLLDVTDLNRNIKSPAEFLNYEIGDYYTQHHNVMNYMKYLNSTHSDMSVFIKYGETNQKRDLNLLIISSKENIKNLNAIKEANVKIAKGQSVSMDIPTIVWLSYNVHGNETSSSEASMLTAYHLLAGTSQSVQDLLANSVVIIDPMMNPDGRERYINWFKNSVGLKANEDINATEHQEPWPGGRSNHYMFDLNRDWAFASQIETQQRLLVYHQFKPHVFVDFHEMGHNSGYFFFPATKPINPILPSTTVKWGKKFGEGNGEMLDRFGSLFYTAEHFDLFYPGYGDSYPSLYGSIGMTYEQSGHSRSGKKVLRNDGSVLTLRERAHNHYKTSIATLTTAVTNKKELIDDFKSFFKSAKTRGAKDDNKYYIIDQSANYKELLKLLAFHDLEIKYVKNSKKVKLDNGKNYQLSVGQAILPIEQAQYVMLRNLFDDQIFIPDTAFYDISSWSIPKAFNVPVYKTSSSIQIQDIKPTQDYLSFAEAKVAYAFTPKNIQSYQFLNEIQKYNVKSRVVSSEIKSSGIHLMPGSVLISKKRNQHIPNLHELLSKEALKYDVEIFPLQKGMSDSGVDLGSGNNLNLKNVRLAILTGESFSSLKVGALWQLFDQKLDIKATMINIDHFNRADLDIYTTLIIAGDYGGGYSINRALGENGIKKLKSWIQDGGHVIGLDNGAKFLTEDISKITSVKVKEQKDDNSNADEIINVPYNKRSEYYSKRSFPGAFFKVDLDFTHPLTVGLSKPFFVLKTNRTALDLNRSFFNIGKFSTANDVLGYAAQEDIDMLKASAFLLHDSMGSGSITLINSDPVFRAFTYGTTQLLLNCVFLGNANY